MTHSKLKYTTPKGITFEQFEEVLEVAALKKYMYSSKRNRRIRYLYACLVYFDMEQGVGYTSEQLVSMAVKYNAIGNSALSVSIQSIGQHMTRLCHMGVLNYNTVANKRHYYKVI